MFITKLTCTALLIYLVYIDTQSIALTVLLILLFVSVEVVFDLLIKTQNTNIDFIKTLLNYLEREKNNAKQ